VESCCVHAFKFLIEVLFETFAAQEVVQAMPFSVKDVGAGLERLKAPLKPVLSVAPGSMLSFHEAGVTVT
jgi:hypothetical protein